MQSKTAALIVVAHLFADSLTTLAESSVQCTAGGSTSRMAVANAQHGQSSIPPKLKINGYTSSYNRLGFVLSCSLRNKIQQSGLYQYVREGLQDAEPGII